jgi:hypothetical protein
MAETAPPQHPMRVIGAGFGRTGTASLKRALETLGFGPCHHMEEVIKRSGEAEIWARAGRGEKIDWKAVMSPWGSSCDFPSALYYRELMAAFPDAKVVLTIRDASSWYASMSETIVPMFNRFPNRFVLPLLPFLGAPRKAMDGTSVKREVIDRFADKAHVMKVFDDHIEEVKRVVPKEKLLVFEAKQGWEPLCAFLEVPVPKESFPRTNDTAEFKKRVIAATVISWVLLLVPMSIGLSILGWVLR